jgi:enolase
VTNIVGVPRREILDSRGDPAVEAEFRIRFGSTVAQWASAVPSGCNWGERSGRIARWR